MKLLGVAKSISDVDEIILKHEVLENTKYIVQQSRNANYNVNDLDSLQSHRLRWETPQIAFDGIPFIIIASQIRECHQGFNRRMNIECKEEDHCYGRKRLLQQTKKVSCSAKLQIKIIVKLPEYHLLANLKDNAWARDKTAKYIRNTFSINTAKVLEYHIFSLNTHTNHLIGEMGSYSQNIDKSLIEKIYELVDRGITKVADVKKHLQLYTENIICPSIDATIHSNNRRFYPTDRDIRNHIYRSITESRFSKDEQLELKEQILKWKKNYPHDNFFFRAAASDYNEEMEPSSFLFIHQSCFQKDLLMRYGGEICLLDATYNTTKYDLPLFFLCVNTNVGYSIVASMLLGRENTASIKEGLNIIRVWNPTWKPSYFMCDMDNREIRAIEEIFEACSVNICDFHREQCWERWLSSIKHGVAGNKKNILIMLRAIANSTTKEEFEETVNILRSSTEYQKNPAFVNYIEKTWLSCTKRWVTYFRNSLLNNRINTSNGLERQHKELKHNYLKNHTSGQTLVGMLQVLIGSFLKDSMERYKRYNIESMNTYKSYVNKIPDFLIGKPKKFVQHCMSRILRCGSIQLADIDKNNNFAIFTVSNDETGETYSINLDTDIPTCTCKDYINSHWPCKHMLAIFHHFPNYGWEYLKDAYTSQCYFNIDNSVLASGLSAHNKNENQVNNTEEKVNNPSVDCLFSENIALLKNIKSDLYNIHSHDANMYINNILVSLEKFTSEQKETLHGLPLRKRSKLRKESIGKKRSKYTTQTHMPKFDCNGSETDSNLQRCTEAFIVNETILGNVESINFMEKEKEVLDIWSNKSSDISYIRKIGPYTLTNSSIKAIQSLLTDEVIDAYLYQLTNKISKTFHINCVIMTAIFTNQSDIHVLMTKVNIFSYERLIGAVNERGNHWILMIILPQKHEIIFLNPLGETLLSQQEYLENWYLFLNKRKEAGIEKDVCDWRILSPKHAMQIDGQSCGVYVLLMAECFLKGKNLQFIMKAEDVLLFRKVIACKLMSDLDAEKTFEDDVVHGSEESTSVSNSLLCY